MKTLIFSLILGLTWIASTGFAARATNAVGSPKSSSSPIVTKPNITALEAWKIDLDKSKGAVEFDAVGRPSALKIHGKGEGPTGSFTMEVKGNEVLVTGVANFTLNSLETGIQMRNEHMKKKYLETEKFPDAKLTLTQWKISASPQTDPLSLKDQTLQGVLFLHGVEKPVTGKINIERAGTTATFKAEFDLKISDFNIAKPGFAGITMAEDVKVTLNGGGTLKKP